MTSRFPSSKQQQWTLYILRSAMFLNYYYYCSPGAGAAPVNTPAQFCERSTAAKERFQNLLCKILESEPHRTLLQREEDAHRRTLPTSVGSKLKKTEHTTSSMEAPSPAAAAAVDCGTAVVCESVACPHIRWRASRARAALVCGPRNVLSCC